MRHRAITILIGAAAGYASAVQAHDAPNSAQEPARFELTPFISYQFGGQFELQQPEAQATEDAKAHSHAAYALAFDIRADPSLQYEFFYARQRTEVEAPDFTRTGLDVQYLHVGGTAVFGETQSVFPYTVGSIGFTHLSLDAPGAHDETPFSISFGVGLRVPVKPRFDVRLEARAFLSFIEENSAVFCGSGAAASGCVLRGNGSLFTQYAVMAGAAFSF